MKNKAINTINKHNLLLEGDKVIIALSGGADSMALLFFLHEIKNLYNIEIFALHVNHMIRGGESVRDLNFVKEYCKSKNIKLLTYNKDVKKRSIDDKMSVEEAGRAARTDAFEDGLNVLAANKIAVAHNKNDQAETFLLRLARGAGTNGLRCIEYKTGNRIRPLLDCGREEIEEYVAKNNIPYVTDSTNLTDIYDRNKVRLNLIPWLKDNLNPNIVNTITSTIDIMREQTDYLNTVSMKAYNKCLHSHSNERVVIYRERLCKNDIAIKKLVIRIALKNVSKSLKDITTTHINSIMELCGKATGKRIILPENIICETQYEYLIIKRPIENEKICYEIELNRPKKINEKGIFVLISDNDKIIYSDIKYLCTKMVRCDKIFLKAYLRTRLPGDKIRLKAGTKKLKKFFIDKKISRERRDEAYLLVINEEVVSVLNIVDAVTQGQYTYYVYIWEDTDGQNRSVNI